MGSRPADRPPGGFDRWEEVPEGLAERLAAGGWEGGPPGWWSVWRVWLGRWTMPEFAVLEWTLEVWPAKGPHPWAHQSSLGGSYAGRLAKLFAYGFAVVVEGIPPVIARRVGYQLLDKLFAGTSRFQFRNGRALNQDPAVLRAAVEAYTEKIRPAWTP